MGFGVRVYAYTWVVYVYVYEHRYYSLGVYRTHWLRYYYFE